MNLKHNRINCSPNEKIGEGPFGLAFDVITGLETEAEVLTLEWREQKKNVNTSKEKENNAFTFFLCNICNKGFDSEAEITEHINDKHKSFMR